jgi:hypothetical protein
MTDNRGGIVSATKIKDIRVKISGSDVWVYVSFLGGGQNLFNHANVTRAALMLDVFNSGRDCYWFNDALVTSATPPTMPDSPLDPKTSSFKIDFWDARIPLTEPVEFTLALVDPTRPEHTSGSCAAQWKTIAVADDSRASVILAVLGSKYRKYVKDGTILNTDFDSDFLAPVIA